MSRHDGVSCDVCHRANFIGKRYACLICYDYDLCSACHEMAGTSGNHAWDHPVQCILTKRGYELYYGSENTHRPHAFTCPLCGSMGFSEPDLIEHVEWNHGSDHSQVICSICAGTSRPGPVQPRDDFLHHLSVDHRPAPRDLTSILDEHPNHSNNLRRLLSHSRPLVSTRGGRRSGPMYIVSSSTATSNPSERSDPPETVSELLSQLSMAGLGQETGVLSSRVRVPLADIARSGRLPPFASQTSGTSTDAGVKPSPSQGKTSGKRVKTTRDSRFLLPKLLEDEDDSAMNVRLSERGEFLKQLIWSSLRSTDLSALQVAN